jgi:hypothetical protein
MQDVDSLRMTGQVRYRGTQYFVDLHLERSGDCTGSLRLRGTFLDVRRVGDRTWVQGDSAFVRQAVGGDVPAAALDRLRGKWLPVDDTSFGALCDLDGLLKSFRVVDFGTAHRGSGKRNKGNGELDVTVAEETDLDGTTAVKISGRPGGSHDEHVWVASDAPHRVIKIESTATSDGGQLAFGEFDRDVEVAPPAPKDVFRA